MIKIILLIAVSINIFASNITSTLKNIKSISTIDYIIKHNKKGNFNFIDYHNRFKYKTKRFKIYGNLGVIKYPNKRTKLKKLHNTIYFDYLYAMYNIYTKNYTRIYLVGGVIPMLGGNIEKYKNYDIPRGNGMGILGKYSCNGVMVMIANKNTKYKIGYGRYSKHDFGGNHYFLKDFYGSKGISFIYDLKHDTHNLEIDYYHFMVNYPRYNLVQEPLNLYGIGYIYDNSIKSDYAVYVTTGYSSILNKYGNIYKMGVKFYFDSCKLPIEYDLGLEYTYNTKNFYNLDNTLFKKYMVNMHGELSEFMIYTDVIFNNKFYITPSFVYIDNKLLPGIKNIYSLKFRYKF